MTALACETSPVVGVFQTQILGGILQRFLMGFCSFPLIRPQFTDTTLYILELQGSSKCTSRIYQYLYIYIYCIVTDFYLLRTPF